jgi:hypothetical protein
MDNSGERDYTRVAEHDLEDCRTLPLELERRLADDFAFLSSSEFGVRHVTTATIGQCMLSSSSLVPNVVVHFQQTIW